MISTNGMFATRKLKGEEDGFSLLEATGYVKVISPGCIALLPFGARVIDRIKRAVQYVCESAGFWEISLPLLQRYELWEESGRAAKYPGLLCETMIGGDKRYVINPTQEEAVLDLFRSSGFMMNDLPLQFFHIGERVRNEIRPAFGLMRSRAFLLADLYGLTCTEAEHEQMAECIGSIMKRVITWGALPARQGEYYPSAMDAVTHSYWVPSATKQGIAFVCKGCDASFKARKQPESCPKCGSGDFDRVEAAEIGDVMRSARNLSEAMCATPVNGEEPVYVAMAGIGISRLLQLLAEYHSDDHGLVWPFRMAPFHVHIIADESRMEEAEHLHNAIHVFGYDAFVDARPISFGKRFVDADLIGIPLRVVAGKRTGNGMFEVKRRACKEVLALDQGGVIALLNDYIRKEMY
jgi:prolyl-tRNA synthetase